MKQYKGYTINTFPEYLSTEERLARKEWRAIIKSWRYTIRRSQPTREYFEGEGFQTEQQAIKAAEKKIDSM